MKRAALSSTSVMRLFLLCAAISLCLSVSAVKSQTVDIPKEQARNLAAKHMLAGNNEAALSIANALIAADHSDAHAHLIAAQTLRAKGDYRGAKAHASLAFEAATTAQMRYVSAMVMAQSLSANGQKSAGQLWLRRAAEVAPNEQTRLRAIHDFRYVRDTNPWQYALSFGARPSSNINNGTRDTRFYWGGLVFVNPDVAPLSGLELEAGAKAFYRPNKQNRERLAFGINFETRQYVLSEDAKNTNPNARASDFAYTLLEGHLIQTWRGERQPNKMQRISRFGLTAGANSYGGEHLSNFIRAWGSNRFGLTERSYFTALGSVERTWRKDASIRDSDLIELGGTYGYHLKRGGQINLYTRLGDKRSDSNAIAHDNLRLGLVYSSDVRIAGGLPSLSFEYEGRWYDFPRELPDPRRDNKYSAALTLVMDRWDFYGFAPEFKLNYSRNHSNVTQYETLEYGLDFGIRSVF